MFDEESDNAGKNRMWHLAYYLSTSIPYYRIEMCLYPLEYQKNKQKNSIVVYSNRIYNNNHKNTINDTPLDYKICSTQPCI